MKPPGMPTRGFTLFGADALRQRGPDRAALARALFRPFRGRAPPSRYKHAVRSSPCETKARSRTGWIWKSAVHPRARSQNAHVTLKSALPATVHPRTRSQNVVPPAVEAHQPRSSRARSQNVAERHRLWPRGCVHPRARSQNGLESARLSSRPNRHPRAKPKHQKESPRGIHPFISTRAAKSNIIYLGINGKPVRPRARGKYHPGMFTDNVRVAFVPRARGKYLQILPGLFGVHAVRPRARSQSETFPQTVRRPLPFAHAREAKALGRR